ncbi:hypothetical protein HDV02_001144, partial [Globomyces sp. JEL0801]
SNKSKMYFYNYILLSTIATTVTAHGFLSAPSGLNGQKATKVNVAGEPCGKVQGTFPPNAADLAATTVTLKPGDKTAKIQYIIQNGDGAGPVNIQFDPSGTGDFSTIQNATISQQVPGVKGILKGARRDAADVIFEVPANLNCPNGCLMRISQADRQFGACAIIKTGAETAIPLPEPVKGAKKQGKVGKAAKKGNQAKGNAKNGKGNQGRAKGKGKGKGKKAKKAKKGKKGKNGKKGSNGKKGKNAKEAKGQGNNTQAQPNAVNVNNDQANAANANNQPAVNANEAVKDQAVANEVDKNQAANQNVVEAGNGAVEAAADGNTNNTANVAEDNENTGVKNLAASNGNGNANNAAAKQPCPTKVNKRNQLAKRSIARREQDIDAEDLAADIEDGLVNLV